MSKLGWFKRLMMCLSLGLLVGCQVFKGGWFSAAATATPVLVTLTQQPTRSVTQAPSATSTQSVSERVPLNSLKGITLVFWHPYLDNLSYWLEFLADEFNQQNTYGITVQVVSQGNPAELYRQIEAILPGSHRTDTASLPDVVIASPEQALSWEALSPVLTDLSGYIQDSSAGLTQADLADFYTPWWRLGTSGSSQFGIPAVGEMQVLFYNQTWANKLGFTTAPTTQTQFAAQACAAEQANRKDSSDSNDGTGGWLVDTAPLTLLNWLSAFGGGAVSTQNQFAFSSTANNNAFGAIQSLIAKDCAWSGNANEPYDYFANREALFTSNSLEQISTQTSAFKSAQNTDTWTVIGMPSTGSKPVVTASGSNYYILSSSATQQMAAWLFVRWMSAAAGNTILVQHSGTFPLRASELSLLKDYQAANPQWAAALSLVSNSLPQPVNADWRVAQNMLQDAGQQLVSSETKATQVPGILSDLDTAVAELLEPTALPQVTLQTNFSITGTVIPANSTPQTPTPTPTP